MTRRDGERLVLEGPVTIQTVPALLGEARAACRDGARRVDFAAVEDVDSAALALAVALLREAAADGRGLEFANLPAAMVKLAELYSVSGLIDSTGS